MKNKKKANTNTSKTPITFYITVFILLSVFVFTALRHKQEKPIETKDFYNRFEFYNKDSLIHEQYYKIKVLRDSIKLLNNIILLNDSSSKELRIITNNSYRDGTVVIIRDWNNSNVINRTVRDSVSEGVANSTKIENVDSSTAVLDSLK